MESKFLSDGRKVTIIGQLNNTEWIVQEVFVTAQGDEIPSGERFTTKSLHDSPVETYKDRQEKKLNESIRALQNKETAVQESIKKLERERTAYEKTFKSTKALSDSLLKQIDEGAFNLLCDVMAGNVKYLIEDSGYGVYEPKLFLDAIKAYDSYETEIKLISLFGRSDGSLVYKLNQYYDGSGSAREIKLIRTDEELAQYYTDKVKEIFEKNPNYISTSHITIAKKYGGVVAKEVVDSACAKKIESLKNNMEEYQNKFNSAKREFELFTEENDCAL